MLKIDFIFNGIRLSILDFVTKVESLQVFPITFNLYASFDNHVSLNLSGMCLTNS